MNKIRLSFLSLVMSTLVILAMLVIDAPLSFIWSAVTFSLSLVVVCLILIYNGLEELCEQNTKNSM